MAFEREEIRLPGGVLTYLVAGSGSPIVYIHGGEGAQANDALLRLSQERRIYMPILPALDGGAGLDGVRSARQLALLLGDFVETMIGGPCDIVGHSFGGWVALWLAAEKPDCVDHLVLESPLGFVAEGREQLVRRNPALAPIVAASSNDDVMPALADMSCVTLLLAGADDDVVAPAVRQLKSALRKSYLIYVYGARHAIAIDQPARFLGVVTDFLAWGEAFLVNRADQRTPLSRAADAAYG